MTIRIISTGGTFEKIYDPLLGALSFTRSVIPRVLRTARSALPVTELMLIDSQQMTQRDRQLLIDACHSATESSLVIVHGTDTMVETAEKLASAHIKKTIVMTGAMIPEQVNGSDASFNLGYALAIAQTAPVNVWIAMNSQTFAWDKVVKNRDHGVFQSK